MSEINTVTATKGNKANGLSDEINGIFLAFVDAINKPISNLIVKISAGSKIHKLRTDNKGHLPIIGFDPNATEGIVSALLPTGVEEEILKFWLDTGVQSYLCKSPYLLLKSEAELHIGTATESSKPTLKQTGETEKKRSKDGAPVV
jgi:hypothetical protein